MTGTRFLGRPPRQLAGRGAKRAQHRPRSLKSGIGAWVLSWLLGSIVLAVGAVIWQAQAPATTVQARQPLVRTSTYDAARCDGVTQTWQEAAEAADQFRLTGQQEYQADAERLRNQARRDGRLYCTGDPLDR
jgi:hypothetical protein